MKPDPYEELALEIDSVAKHDPPPGALAGALHAASSSLLRMWAARVRALPRASVNAELVEALRAVEWVWDGDGYYCPSAGCRRERGTPHDTCCTLAAALARAEEATR